VKSEFNSLPIRNDLTAALQRAWNCLSLPGTWWDGTQRLEIVAEARHAAHCQLCADRKATLSPGMVQGHHDSQGNLSPAVVACIHRIATDSGRLTETWHKDLLERGISDCEYVEIVSLVNMITALDTFNRAMGAPIQTLPAPVAGAPTRKRPRGAKPGTGWVPTLFPEDLTADDPDPYTQFHAYNIQLALGLVPQEVINFFDLDTTLYPSEDEIEDLDVEKRAISRIQMELIAARGASINGCHYCATCHSLHLHKLGQSASEAIDLNGVLTGSTDENGIEHGALIIAFVDALLNNESNGLADIRNEILQKMGAEGLVDTAASIASFNSIVRVANATGTQLDRLVTDQLDDLSGNTAWLEHVPDKN
jgi:AhpD family alkylhydroperoxidase